MRISNKYIDEQAPWALVKTDVAKAQVVCTVALNTLRILIIYLSPVLPKLCEKLTAFLGIQTHYGQIYRRMLSSIKFLHMSMY